MEFSTTVTMPDGQKVKHEIVVPGINVEELEPMVEYFGRTAVAQAAKGNITVQFGKVARSMFENGKSMEEVIATLNTYKPGARVSVAGSGRSRRTKDITPEALEALNTKLGLNLGPAELAAVAGELGYRIIASPTQEETATAPSDPDSPADPDAPEVEAQ